MNIFIWAVRLFSRTYLQSVFFALYKISLAGMNYGMSGSITVSGEGQVLEVIKRTLEKKSMPVVFDVGANVGEYAKLLTETVPPKTKIYAFEPSISSYKKMKETLHAAKNVVLENLGLGQKKGSFTLFSDQDESGFASMYQRKLDHIGIQLSKKEKIQIITLDDYCKKKDIRHIEYLKLDVEGNELNVLKGASELLSKKAIDIIQFEFGGCNIDSRTYFQDYFLLLEKDFNIYRILQHGFHKVEKYHEMLEVFVNSNFLAVRKGLHTTL